VAAPLQDSGRPEAEPRPTPLGQERHATLEGESVALARLVQRVAPQEGPQIQHRVALTDGAEALQPPVVPHWPEHTLGLEIIHATEYLWGTANCLLGAIQPHRTVWVRSSLEPRVAGQTEAVLAALEAEADDPTDTATQRRAVRRPVGYYRRHRSYMRETSTWPRAGRWGRESATAPVGLWCKIAWNSRGCAGPKLGPTRCSTCGPYGSVGIGIVMGRFLGNSNGSITALRRCPCRPKASCGGGQRDEPLSTDFGHTRLR
jgi:hypothetical protein